MIRLILAFLAALIGLALILPTFVLLVPIWLFTASVRAIQHVLARRSREWDEIVRFEPDIGWKPRSHLDTRYADQTGDSCTVRTDADGWPGAHTIGESDIIVFGDSFAFGYGVPADLAYYARGRSQRFKAIGAPGYNMVQELMLMRRYSGQLRGKHVVWFVCIENDLAENLKAYTSGEYTNPYLRSAPGTDSWEVVTEHVQMDRWRHGDGGIGNVLLFAHLCTPCPYSERVFSAARYLIGQAQELCQNAGTQLTVYSIPYKKQLSQAGLLELKQRLADAQGFDPGYPDKRLSSICGDLNVSFISGASHLNLKDYKARDGHWNVRGNDKVAQILEEHVQKARTA